MIWKLALTVWRLRYECDGDHSMANINNNIKIHINTTMQPTKSTYNLTCGNRMQLDWTNLLPDVRQFSHKGFPSHTDKICCCRFHTSSSSAYITAMAGNESYLNVPWVLYKFQGFMTSLRLLIRVLHNADPAFPANRPDTLQEGHIVLHKLLPPFMMVRERSGRGLAVLWENESKAITVRK